MMKSQVKVRLSGISNEPRAFVVYGSYRFWLTVCVKCRKTPLLTVRTLPYGVLRDVGYKAVKRDLEDAGVDWRHWAYDTCLSCTGDEPEDYPTEIMTEVLE